MDSNQFYQTIKILQDKVSDLEAENADLKERQKHCQLEGVLPLVQKPLYFKYTLEVLKNIRRYILEKRERYLAGLVQIQSYLLSFEHPETVFTKVLEIIGQCSQATRVYLYQNYFDSEKGLLATQKYVCHNSALNSDLAQKEILDYERSFPRWLKILGQGNFLAEEVKQLPPSERLFFRDQNIDKILLLPLIVNGNFWGFLGLEYGGKQRLWENSEITLLESIVGAISLVLQRREAQTNLENLNQELEIRVQKRTAELELKNSQLQQEIVKHEQTMAALQKAKEQLEVVLDAVPASISWISSDLRYLGVNKHLADQVNLTPEDFINKLVGGPKSHYEFMSYLINFFKSDLDKSTAEFMIKNGDQENTFLMVAKKYDQGEAAVLVGIDISDRRRAEEALSKSAALNQAVLNAIPDSMFYLTENGTFLRCKIANENELPFNCTRLLNQNIAQVLPAQITDKFKQAMAQTIATEETQLMEFQLLNSQNLLIDWEVRIALSHQDKVVAIWRNITEKKQAELSLKLSEEKLRSTFEQAAVGIAHTDLNGHWLRVNKKLCQIVGYSRSELLESDFQSITHPDDLELDRKSIQKMLSGELSTCVIEKRYLHKQGFPVWINLTVSLVRDGEGKAKYFIAVIEDISNRKQTAQALKESSSRLKMALEAANMGTWQWNLVNKQLFWSEQSRVLFGFNKPNLSFTYQEFLNCIHPKDREKIEQAIAYSLENKSAYFQEYRIIKPGEKIHWIASQGDVFSDSQEQEISLIGIDMDITERKQSEEEMRKSLVKEKELNQLKSNFITMTSHEFRTPLSTILGCAELLEYYGEQWTNQKKQKYLTRIYTTVQNLTKMLDELLLIGKSESGGFEFEPTLLNLSEFCINLVQEFNLGEHHRISFNIEPNNSEILTSNYLFDQKLLRHILTNLLSNALKYSSDQVNFNLIIAQNKASLSIQDQGIGIPPDDLKQIFESFHRGKNVGKIPGTGLGLAIVKKAVDIHGGKIQIESQVNQGTIVTVTFNFNHSY